MTVDEELNHLDDGLRRLKIEYDIFFGGGSKKPPADLEWRVQSLLKKYSDARTMNIAQRFRYNSMAQKYAIYSDLWRQKAKIKEEGYRRPQDALLAIQGLRTEQEHAAAAEEKQGRSSNKPFIVAVTDVTAEQDSVKSLFTALHSASTRTGTSGGPPNFEAFQQFVQQKTAQIRNQYGCTAVEYEVELKSGRVKLTARPKK